jgi:hypothetical protein
MKARASLRRLLPVLAGTWLSVSPCARAAEVRWVDAPAHPRVEVSGAPAAALSMWLATEPCRLDWQKILTVRVQQASVVDDVDTPPMLGRYGVRSNLIVFTPEFPLQPGLRYRAEFRPAALPGGDRAAKPLTATLAVPGATGAATTVVSAVYPTAAELPENLLKFYLHFSAPMSRGHIYDHIRLLDDTGAAVELPFLEIDEELWNPEMTRLTLFIDPGRIKRGVKPLEEIGPSLEAGKSYTLVIAREWRDANGRPLKESFRKRFRVVAPDREPPDPQRWRITAPRAGTRDVLTVRFDGALDEALARRLIRVERDGREVAAAKVWLSEHEQQWNFVPAADWVVGAHALAVQTTIEDLAGNNIGKPFEVDLFESVERRSTSGTVRVPFEVSR